MFSILMTFNRF